MQDSRTQTARHNRSTPRQTARRARRQETHALEERSHEPRRQRFSRAVSRPGNEERERRPATTRAGSIRGSQSEDCSQRTGKQLAGVDQEDQSDATRPPSQASKARRAAPAENQTGQRRRHRKGERAASASHGGRPRGDHDRAPENRSPKCGSRDREASRRSPQTRKDTPRSRCRRRSCPKNFTRLRLKASRVRTYKVVVSRRAPTRTTPRPPESPLDMPERASTP